MRNSETAILDTCSGRDTPASEPETIERSLGLKLTVVSRIMRNRFDHSASNIGITRAQWSTLSAVAGAEGCTQRVIAALLEVTEVTAGRQVDRLVEQGWLERRLDPGDRRAYRIYLTPQVSPVLEKLRILGEEQEMRALAGLNDQELQALHATLDRIANNLNAPFNDKPGTLRRLLDQD